MLREKTRDYISVTATVSDDALREADNLPVVGQPPPGFVTLPVKVAPDTTLEAPVRAYEIAPDAAVNWQPAGMAANGPFLSVNLAAPVVLPVAPVRADGSDPVNAP
jgi:hypothetical protein